MKDAKRAVTASRRDCIKQVGALWLWGISAATAATAATAPTPTPVVLVVGDSLSAEYGLKSGSGWVALLERKLEAEKLPATVVNASVSGDTSSGGRSRLPALLKQYQPTVVVIELGGNDALRGLPLSMTERNLAEMTRAAKAAGAKVLLTGMQVPPNYGRQYNEDFAALFVKVSKAEGASLLPFLLKGVGDGPNATELFQPDRIHPTEAAHPIILNNVWPLLRPLLK